MSETVLKMSRILFLTLLTFASFLVGVRLHTHQPVSAPGNASGISLDPFPYSEYPAHPEIVVHMVQKGESLSLIAQKYFVSCARLCAINQVRNPDRIRIGDRILVPPLDLHVAFLRFYAVRDGESGPGLLQRFGLERWQWERLNPTVPLDALSNGQTVLLPRNELKPKLQPTVATRFLIPVRGAVTSRYGWRWGRMHTGIDLAAPTGTPVRAAENGRVRFSGWRGGYGLLIIIDHSRFRTYYGHLSASLVKPGQAVGRGETIGLVGATGHSFGSHLHFEVEQQGHKLNPSPFLRGMVLP